MNIHEQIEILKDQINDEYEASCEYYEIYKATQMTKYLEMAREELGHADQIIIEARKVSTSISMDSPYLYYKQVKYLEELYHEVEELREDLE